jgi:hypothetical protein
VELSKQLSEAKSDIKILNQEEKRLKESVKKHMIDQGIDTINLRKGKISLRKSVRKSGVLTRMPSRTDFSSSSVVTKLRWRVL